MDGVEQLWDIDHSALRPACWGRWIGNDERTSWILVGTERTGNSLSAVFGGLATLLAAPGLYGVVTYSR
jgi:hypothetical protein